MFYSNSETAFRIKGVFYVKGKAQTLSERNRKHTALSFRVKGNSRFWCDGDEMTARDGSVAYFPSGVDYKRRTYSDEELYVIHFSAFGDEEKRISVISGRDDLAPLFEALYNEWTGGGDQRYNKCMAMLYKIFSRLETNGTEYKEVPKVIAQGVSILNTSFRDPAVNVALLAEKCHISETYFRKVYKAHYGVSPIDALLTKRLEYAAELLASGYYQIKEIAALSGYTDTKYFRAAFKKRYKMTPNEYSVKNSRIS